MIRVSRARGTGGRRPAVLGFALVLLAQATIALAVLVAVPSPASAWTPHPPIVINGNAEFTPANGVTGGSGTDSDPYVIEGWEIAATTWYGISIKNTTAPFIVRGNFIHSGGSSFDGIAFERVRNGVADGNVVSGNQFGFRIVVSTNVTLSANNVSNNRGGMYVGDSSDMVIVANVISSHVWQGISVTNSTLLAITDNEISNSQSGIFLSSSTNATLQANRFTSDGVLLDGNVSHFSSHTITPDNLVNGKPLLYYRNCNGLTVDSVPVGELIVANCTGVRVTNLDIQGTDVGILLGFAEDVTLSGNTIAANDVGVSAMSSVGVTFEGDWIHDNEYGMFLWNLTDAIFRTNNVSRNWRGTEFYGSRGATLANNMFSWNTDAAMILGTANNVRLLGNTVSNNGNGISYGGFSQNAWLLENDVSANVGWGIVLSSIANLTVSGNRVSSNGDYGIILGYGSNVSLEGNVVANNREGVHLYGAPLLGPPGVVVRHNALLGNALQGFDDQGNANAWDDGYPSGGNFWSDYAGVDNCSGPLQNVCPNPDGIGDTPYAIDADSRDLYPLMDPPFLLRIDTNPSGLSVRVDGVDRTPPALVACVQGSTHTIEATSPQMAPDVRHFFTSWSDGGAQTHDVVCDANRTVTANYRTEYRLTLDTMPTGFTIVYDGVSYATPAIFWCDAGSVHTAQAPSPVPAGPDRRYVFLRWLDGNISSTRLITCTAPAWYTAVYGGESFATFDTSPAGLTVILDGTTFVTPLRRWCADGPSLLVGTASPQYIGPDRYDFDHWSDGGAQTHAITCTAPGTITAFFLGPFGGSPVVTLTAPIGGEIWTGGTSHSILWTMSDPDTPGFLAVDIMYSTDGGATYPNMISSGLRAQGGNTFVWTVPLINSSTVRIRVCASDGTQQTCDGSANFAIDSTRPVSLDIQPPNGAVAVDVNASIILTFSERMNPVATEAAIAIDPPISGTSSSWDPTGQILTISPGAPLNEFATYTVTVYCGALDASDPGNPLQGCSGGVQVQFQTEIVTPPPKANAVDVPEAGVGELVTFDGGASTGNIAAWTWTITDDTGATLATLDGEVATHRFTAPGTYRITLRVTDSFGRTDEYSFDVAVRAAGGGVDAWVLAIVTATVLATILFAASEPGRVALLTATAGRAYAGKPKDEEDSEFRGAILYFVRVHPGDTYMDIKRNLGLNDGVVTYHLARLEKDGLIRSGIQGARKRYYPADMRLPLENGGELHEIQQRILKVVAAAPGMPVAVLAEQLGASTQLTLYHLRKLSQADRVRLERSGFRLRAYPPGPNL